MNLLAFDTSTDACSVALQVGDDVLVDHRIARQQHAQLLLPMIDRLMADASLAPGQLTGVVFGQGPGSFTGVRMAVAAAQGLGLALDIGVLGISTLQCLAQGASRKAGVHRVWAVLDARMNEVYLADYRADDSGRMQLQGRESVGSASAAPPGVVAVGSGAERYSDVLGCPVYEGYLPEAQDLLALLGAYPLWRDAADAQPVYLRDKVARTEAERRDPT